MTPAAALSDVFDVGTETAVRYFQQSRGLNVDGIVGPATTQAIGEASWQLGDRVLEAHPARELRGDDVAALQHRLLQLGFAVGRVDGVFGPVTQQALAEFQTNVGLPADGAAGPATFRALTRLSPVVSGGRADVLRERELLINSGPRLSGKMVVVDPGHGGEDPGRTRNGLVEAHLAYDLATRVVELLSRNGVSALLTRGADDHRTDRQRADFANSRSADLLVSLHFDAVDSPNATGVATYYYGSGTQPVCSVLGEQLADLVNREVAARTGMVNGGSHPKTWDLLRFTGMPAVHTELGYLSNADDVARLGDPLFRDVLADALIASIQRLYLPPEMDVSTGRLHLRGLLA